mgnify:CR=1 FL=1
MDSLLAELTALAPEVGEEEELAAARATMQKGARLTDDLATISELFGQGSTALAQGLKDGDVPKSDAPPDLPPQADENAPLDMASDNQDEPEDASPQALADEESDMAADAEADADADADAQSSLPSTDGTEAGGPHPQGPPCHLPVRLDR